MVQFDIEFIRVCPYCRKQAKVRNATCGEALCQFKHHIKHMREYWDKYHRKSEQTRTKKHHL